LIRVWGFSDRPKRVCLGPKRPGGADGVNSGFAPPRGFVTGSVHLAMMAAAQRDDEFVAHLAPERPMLREPKVMRIRRLAPTNQTGLLGHELAVALVPKSPRYSHSSACDALKKLLRSASVNHSSHLRFLCLAYFPPV
jgi:hypothetical protein